jgi:hypothetical protein
MVFVKQEGLPMTGYGTARLSGEQSEISNERIRWSEF